MDLQKLLAPIKDDMHAVDRVIGERLQSEVLLINQIGAHIIAAGGKRMRPALVLLTAGALSRDAASASDQARLLAAVIELIHTATLLHDDVVDESGRRRGLQTANAVWGNAGAVLSGDFLYSRSFQMMVDAGRSEVMRTMADATNAIAEGEVLQLMNCGDPEVSEERYLRVIELKTARLFEAAARLGAIAADASAAEQDQMARYGHHLGMAFQMVDDLLDYTADPAASGKNLGTDLAEGKPTLPLIHAMKQADAAGKAMIKQAIVDGELQQLAAVLNVIESTGAIPYTAALAEQHASLARQIADDLPASSYRQSLRDLCEFAVQRAH